MRKRKVFERIYGMKYSWKDHKDRSRHKDRINRVGKLSWFVSNTETITSPPQGVSPWGWREKGWSLRRSSVESLFDLSDVAHVTLFTWFIWHWSCSDVYFGLSDVAHLHGALASVQSWPQACVLEFEFQSNTTRVVKPLLRRFDTVPLEVFLCSFHQTCRFFIHLTRIHFTKLAVFSSTWLEFISPNLQVFHPLD